MDGLRFSDMNPAFPPISDGPWGVPVPDHSPTKTALDPAASPDFNQQDFEGLVECQSCGKQFSRLCDLNKHLKTHSRPFKCPVEKCRYFAFGWPTEKELDRHYNDKHSTEPSVFSCLWNDCNYTSKRESNCKQHMEKAHGYNYIRSRAGNKEEEYPANSQLELSDGGVNPQPGYPTGKLAIRTVPDVLLTPSPLSLGPCFSAQPDAASPLGLHGSMPYGAGPEVYIPWNSPVTRLRNNETFLEEFSQSYGPGRPMTVQDSEWLKVPVDPRLYNPSSSGSNTPDESPVTHQAPASRNELFKALPMIATPRTSPTVTSQVLTPVSEPSPVLVHESDSRREATNPREGNYGRGQRQASTQGLGVSHPGHLNAYGKRHVRFAQEQGDDSDGEEEPPVKRNKAPGGSEEETGDPKMICPFRKAHPEIYDLNVHPKYWSCHTEHHNISTVVRHLGRPAHNMEVVNSRQAISSFNVTDNEHGHPAAGLCKKCWRAFSDRDAFDNHFRTKCETVSRSKREKFQILLDTFCGVPAGNSNNNNNSGSSSPAADSNADEDDAGEDDAEGDLETIDAPPPSHDRSHSRGRGGDDVVSRSEYLALAARVADLERVLATRQRPPLHAAPPQPTPRALPSQQASTVAAARAFTSSPALPASQAFGGYYPGMGPSGAGGGDPRTIVVGSSAGIQHQHQHHQVHQVQAPFGGTGPGAVGPANAQQAAAAAAAASQQSSNALMRDRWEQAVEAGDVILERMDWSGNDLPKFLDLDSQ